ncbi:nuclear transcription factor Y subunit B-1 isoform X1 [Apis laboriosa]|uniref:nuclear transcription factor Y subunit B-1 isoform X1 n=1 Tax=Apis florea TaxID=7463 RepID=UPI000252B413|nr:nuclear transcription factor Y subunit B-1 isoform X1 [Apis florea]XP_006615400.1 nuclear transcription factor Y subunit B-1 isoform X1 [Apis dorsata]XP_043784013.1 nuclear transcription factor Y subunit B-1 isoform X1 [Apis laboriosa]
MSIDKCIKLEMENSGESGDDGGPLGPTAFLGGGGVSASYISVQSDDMEDDPENTDDSNHGASDPLQGAGSGNVGGPLREQDRFLPIANVAKIMKRAIPEAGKIAKDARECVQECVSEFISFITSEASDRCHMEKRKTINGEDILFAMTTLGFDNYVEPLKVYLQKYREATKGDNPGNVPTTGNGKTEPQGTIYEDQLFAIAATASSATTSDTPVIYSYTSTDQMQFQLS